MQFVAFKMNRPSTIGTVFKKCEVTIVTVLTNKIFPWRRRGLCPKFFGKKDSKSDQPTGEALFFLFHLSPRSEREAQLSRTSHSLLVFKPDKEDNLNCWTAC